MPSLNCSWFEAPSIQDWPSYILGFSLKRKTENVLQTVDLAFNDQICLTSFVITENRKPGVHPWIGKSHHPEHVIIWGLAVSAHIVWIIVKRIIHHQRAWWRTRGYLSVFNMHQIKQNHYRLGPTSMKVGRQHKRVAQGPVHNSKGLWLPGIRDKVEPVRKVTVQVIVVRVVTALDATVVSCTIESIFITLHS